MNLMPTLISIGLAASVSLFYLQNQSDKPKEINYRAALSEFEQSAIAFAAHTPLDSNNPQPQSHCQNNMVSDFSKRLPAGSQWTVNIAGLDCDTAILSLSSADSDDFNNLLSAASASGRNYVTETDTSVTPPTKTIKWTQRLYTRTASDLGIRAQLKNNSTNACLAKKCIKNNPTSATVVNKAPTSATVVNKAPTNPNQTKQPKNSNNGKWYNTEKCDKKCGIGKVIYVCIGEVGQVCNGASPVEKCNMRHCPTDGQWSEWKPCSQICGGGTQTRVCDSPKPQHKGKKCLTEKNTRALTEAKPCNTDHCPTDGQWSEWKPCSQICGGGTQTRVCDSPKPQHEGKKCLTEENKRALTEAKPCNTHHCPNDGKCALTACNQPPIVEDRTISMSTDAPLHIIVEATDPEGDELTYTVNKILKGDGNAIFTDSSKNELTFTKKGTNKIFSFVDAANEENIKDEAKLEVVVCDLSLNCSFAIITIEITNTNDPPRIEEEVIGDDEPIFDRNFNVEFTIIDPDYDFNSLPYGSYKLTVDSWLTCSQQGHKVGSMMIICNGIPIEKKEKKDNEFSIDIMFNDGNSTAKKTFEYTAISYAKYLNP